MDRMISRRNKQSVGVATLLNVNGTRRNWVEVPSLPGCSSQGTRLDEAMNNAKEAIEFHTQDLNDEGLEVPKKEDLVMGRVDVRAASSWNLVKS
jgi:predicted RNase H-like HicB family nuclease